MRKWRLFKAMRVASVFAKKSRKVGRTLWVIAFVAVVASLYGFVSYAMGRVRHGVEMQYLDNGRNLAQVYSLIFENMALQSIADLDSYVNSDVMRTGSDKEIIDYIMYHRVWRPKSFLYVFYADMKGTFYSDKGGTTQITDRDYYKDIMNGAQESSVGSSVVARLSGAQVVHVARAVRDDSGNLRGIIGGVVAMNRVESLFANVGKASGFVPFVSDRSMSNLLHMNDDIIPVTDKNTRADLDDGKVRIIAAHNSDGKAARLFIKKIAGMNWYVGAAARDEQFFAVCDTFDRVKIVVFAVALMALLVYYVVSMMSLHKVEKMREEVTASDPITGLLTRQALEKKAQEMLGERKPGDYVMIVADLNGFKFINKIYGEQSGNAALCEYAAMLQTICRSYGGIIARGYADHFYYFAHLRTTLERFLQKFVWISENLSQTARQTTHAFTPKYGISFVSDRKTDYTNGGNKTVVQLIGEASMARKIAKNDSECVFKVYSTAMEDRIAHEQRIEQNMHKALENGEFFVVYQPKMSLSTDKIIGAEALVRWDSPEMGLLPPNDFIPVLERNGFIREVDFAVYEMTFRMLRRLLDKGHVVVPISLNMSRSHTDAEEFIEEFMRRFNKYKLPHDLVELEILERSVSGEKPILQEVTTGFQQMGFSVAMDDFGSGESSLNMLGTISVDTLKFDQNFLRNNEDTEKFRAFITSLVQMAQQLHKKTVFEGVETEEQRDFLRSINCDSVQGYFYSKPLKEDEFVKFLEEHC